MQNVKFIALFIFTVFLFVLCNEESVNPTGNKPYIEIDLKLIGEWECYKKVISEDTIEISDINHMKFNLYSDTSYIKYDNVTTQEGTWRTKNDSLYLKSTEEKYENFYTTYEITGFDLIFSRPGLKEYYKKSSTNFKVPSDLTKSSFYGTWVGYKRETELNGETEVITDQHHDWRNIEFRFSASEAEMTMGNHKRLGSFDYTDNKIVLGKENWQIIYDVESCFNDKLILSQKEEGLGLVIMLYLKKK